MFITILSVISSLFERSQVTETKEEDEYWEWILIGLQIECLKRRQALLEARIEWWG